MDATDFTNESILFLCRRLKAIPYRLLFRMNLQNLAFACGRLLVLPCMFLLMSGCGSEEKKAKSTTPVAEEPKLVFLNWAEYIEPEILTLFKEETGIEVELVEFESIDELEALLQEDGGRYDIALMESASAQTHAELKNIRPLDLSKIGNFAKLKPELVSQPTDPENKYSVPYFYGTTILAYNKRLLPEPPDSWHILWDPKYKGKVGLMDDYWEYLALGHMKNHGSMEMGEPDTWEASTKTFEELLPNLGNITEFNDVIEQVGTGELLLSNCYNGDTVYFAEDFPDLACVVPKEGAMIWVDSIVMCRKAKHPENAHRFINFLLRPEISAMNADTMGFAPVVTEALELIDPELRANEAIFPKDESNLATYPLLTTELQQALDNAKLKVNTRRQEIIATGRWVKTE